MAEPLKNRFGPDIPVVLARMLVDAWPDFPVDAFVRDCLDGYDELELTPRARHISDALATHLPDDRAEALRIVIRSMGPPLEGTDLQGMASFRYLPFVYFVADHGLDDFELAMEAQRLLTQRFTAEFSIRPFLQRHPEATLERLAEWAVADNVHVRRLVSEGTRPRLPWASRLRALQADPTPILPLLETLKDDPEEYVRRSVANNLNDIAKDHPDLVVGIASRWWADGSPERRRLVRHGLRTLIKQAHPGALAVLGFGPDSPVEVSAVRLEPTEVSIGGRIRVEVDLHNPSADEEGGALVDLVVGFVKSDGERCPKVFKGAEVALGPGESTTIRRSVSLAQHSTRTHHPGVHTVDVQLSGALIPGGRFTLHPAAGG